MTELQKRCQELLPVIQAGAEGKRIQVLRSCCTHWEDILDCYTTAFIDNCRYRIKPEPQYRPFTPEEAFAQTGRLVRPADDCIRKCFFVTTCAGRTEIAVSGSKPLFMNSSTFLKDFVFDDDGTPCGVKVSD